MRELVALAYGSGEEPHASRTVHATLTSSASTFSAFVFALRARQHVGQYHDMAPLAARKTRQPCPAMITCALSARGDFRVHLVHMRAQKSGGGDVQDFMLIEPTGGLRSPRSSRTSHATTSLGDSAARR
jgi:hypothetical protein